MKRVLSFLLVIIMLCGIMPTAFAASSEAIAAADTLYALGLFKGTGTDANGKPIYDLDRAPTRHEAVTMLVRILGKEEEAKSGTWDMPFTDVAEWAKPYVGYAYAHGLTSGTSETTFDGDSTITASQFLTFVLRALGYNSSTDFKWDAAWELSDELGFTSGEYSAETTTFLRGDVAIISRNALSAKLKDTETMLVSRLVEDEAVDGMAAARQGFDVYGWLNHIHYTYDIRTFTLYAFMNYTGYDANNGYEISGVRKLLRDELAAANISISAPTYFENRDFISKSVLAALGDAPDFKYISTADVGSEYLALPRLLAEFYQEADIPALYEKYRPYHQELLDEYKEQAGEAILESIAYFRAADYLPEEFGFEVILLEAQERGHSLLPEQNLHDGYAMVRTGPSRANNGVNTINLVHEYYHLVTRPILNRCSSEISALSKYFDRNTVAVTQEGYGTWDEIVNESVVRAISGYFVNGYGESYADREVGKGYVLTRYIYDRIPEFEAFDGDLEAFMRMLLTEYPQYA